MGGKGKDVGNKAVSLVRTHREGSPGRGHIVRTISLKDNSGCLVENQLRPKVSVTGGKEKLGVTADASLKISQNQIEIVVCLHQEYSVV